MTVNEYITLLIAAASLIVAGVSAYFTKQSVSAAERQLALIQHKVGMVTEPARMTEILPVWYIERMSQDTWGFGLLLASGDILAIERVIGVSDDHQWMEVALLEKGGSPEMVSNHPVLYAALKDRHSASVRVDQVQAAFELWSS